jgi:hypothetical protein
MGSRGGRSRVGWGLTGARLRGCSRARSRRGTGACQPVRSSIRLCPCCGGCCWRSGGRSRRHGRRRCCASTGTPARSTSSVVDYASCARVRCGRRSGQAVGRGRSCSSTGRRLVAAWAVSASLFAMFTYLTIYMQNSLGLSAVATGVRFLPLTGAIFVAAGIAGRLTTRVPRRCRSPQASSPAPPACCSCAA